MHRNTSVNRKIRSKTDSYKSLRILKKRVIAVKLPKTGCQVCVH